MNEIMYGTFPKLIGSPNNISHSALCAEAEKFGRYYTEGLWDYADARITSYNVCYTKLLRVTVSGEEPTEELPRPPPGLPG